MVVKHLGNTDFEIIMECFLSAFDNYYVKMPTDYSYYKTRWKAAKVNFNLSYGMFDKEKLVGFIINAVDERKGETFAFNTGTGVIPSYRGKRIVKTIYNYAIPDLLKNGITKCSLEVIVENKKAIQSYKSIGFKICKNFKCFNNELRQSKNELKIVVTTFNQINWKQIPNQYNYSWDFQSKSLEKSNSKYYYVYNKNEVESFFALNLENGTINQLEVLKDNSSNWERLFQAISTIAQKIRIINVDDRLENKLFALHQAGFKNTVNQYEMELTLSEFKVK